MRARTRAQGQTSGVDKVDVQFTCLPLGAVVVVVVVVAVVVVVGHNIPTEF